MPLTKVGDLNFEYYVEGSGPPLLMIRGLGGQAATWGEPFLAKLRPHFKIIRFSNRGTGLSDKPTDALSIRIMADDAAELLTELGIEKAHVFGISMGGMIAQELVLNYPERVQGLVLGCTNCGSPHSVAANAELLTKLRQTTSMPERERVQQFWSVSVTQEFVDREKDFLAAILAIDTKTPTPMETIARQLGAVQAFDSYDRLPQIKAPTLTIHGDRDQLIPAGNAEVLASRISGAQVRIVPGVGHMFFWEKPQESASAIVEFLAKVPVAA